ncbi:protein NETWORKED 2A-like [Andrographis paniculata]|uniref:protein NETWORKED 2A-like n=1 Tax=Andrographis paniculata TaxID=175694 RepID=UPI0021E816CC|nr:protein NETWORKED 2A-like [Andrographis paniculata]
MEDKVQKMLKLIEGNGDSFAKRAEMYYRCRPELIAAVEDTYGDFKALADRYDLLSKDLQNANHTIATVFPEQVQFCGLDDDDDGGDNPHPHPQFPFPSDQNNNDNNNNIPAPPEAANLKALVTAPPPANHLPAKKGGGDNNGMTVKKLSSSSSSSGLSREAAEEEIVRMEKEILALQTVKEFVKSSYEAGLAKYWEIENQITAMHAKASALQDHFTNIDAVIDDDEARILMAQAAIDSCDRTLSALREKHKSFTVEAMEERKKIESSQQLLHSLKDYCSQNSAPAMAATAEATDRMEKMTLTATELADKIDEVVNKVIGLESMASSQMVLINTLRTTADDLSRMLNDEKETTTKDEERFKQLEDKLRRVQNLDDNLEAYNNSLESQFDQARSTLDHLSRRLNLQKSLARDAPDDDDEDDDSNLVGVSPEEDLKNNNNNDDDNEDKVKQKSSSSSSSAAAVEARERMLLQEYTEILKNYKDVRQKQREEEKKQKDHEFNTEQQIRELKEAITEKDNEVQSLREMLSLVRGNVAGGDIPQKETTHHDDDDNDYKNSLTKTSSSSIPVAASTAINEEKIRSEVDAILDENLDFWLRFSTAYHEMQKFKSEIQDLQDEISNLKNKKKQGVVPFSQLRSEARPYYKHLSEILTELTVWLEQSASLRNELRRRLASLSNILEEISEIQNSNSHNYQVAKLQGEISGMKQENDKVREVLQGSVERVEKLQDEIHKALKQLKDEFGVSSDRPQLQKTLSKARVPLRSFIFGTKPKKQRHSLFSFMQHHRKLHVV